MNCINIKSKEFQALKEASGLPSLILEQRISQWQSVNNTDVYPSYSQLLGLQDNTYNTYLSSDGLQEIGTLEDFAEFTNGKNIVSLTKQLYDDFYNYISDKPIIENNEDFSDFYNSTTEFITVEEASVPELLSELTPETLERNNLNSINEMLFNGDLDVTTVLNKLKLNSDLTTDSLKLVNNLIKVTSKNDVTFKKVNRLEDNRLMAYNPSTQEVLVNQSELGKYNGLEITSIIIHELAHARTLSALNEPKTSSEKAFNKLVRDFYNTNNTTSDSYGFTSVEEFVAEIYSNPEFREEVKNISGGEKGFWSKLVDAIRKIFGLSTGNNKLIDSIINHIENPNISVKQISNNQLFYSPKLKLDGSVTNLDKRLDNLKNKMLDNVDQLINMNKSSQITMATVTQSKTMRQYLLEQTHKNIENTSLIDSYEAIQGYIKMSNDVFNAVYKDLKSTISATTNVAKTEDGSITGSRIDFIEKYLSVFNLGEDIESTAISMLKEFQLRQTNGEDVSQDIEDVNKLITNIANVKLVYNNIQNLLNDQRKQHLLLLAANMNNLNLIPQFETKIRAELFNEYNQTKDTENSLANQSPNFNDFFNKRLEMDDIRKRQREYVMDILDEASDDISTTVLYTTDALNIDNSPLIAMSLNLVAQMRRGIIKEARTINYDIAKLEKEFRKLNKGNQPSKMFKNILDQDGDGNYYLKGQYSAKFRSDFYKMVTDIRQSILGIKNKVNTSLDEIMLFSNRRNVGLLLREINSDSFTAGSDYSLTNDKNNKTYNIKITSIDNYDNINNAPDEIIQSIVSQYGFDSFEQFKNSLSFRDISSFAKSNPLVHGFLTGKNGIQVNNGLKIKLNNEQEYAVRQHPDYKQWLNSNTVRVKGKVYPSDKYKTDYDQLSDTEKNTLAYFQNISRMANTDNEGGSSLIKSVLPYLKYEVTKLPSLNKSQREYVIENDYKGIAGAMRRDFGKIENDDIEFGERIDGKGNIIHTPRLHFRQFVEPKQQSLDLFTLFKLEAVNAISFNKKSTYLTRFNAIKHAAENKKYFAQSSVTGKAIKNLFGKRVPDQTFQGINSNEYKKILGIIESNVLDINYYKGGKIAGMDMNKMVDSINGMMSSAALTANYVSGVANLTNGLSQLMIDAFGSRHFTMKDLGAAELEYTRELKDIIEDLGRPNKQAKVNQLIEIFDIKGGFNAEQQSYLYNKIYKQVFSRQSMNGLNEVGEHHMSGVLLYSVLKGIKVMDNYGVFVDKTGKQVTDEKKAASLFDMISKDENGRIKFDTDKFTYTTHTPSIPFSKDQAVGQVALLVKKKMHDMFGAYDPGLQPELYKFALGRMLLTFKRFLLPGLEARYKGFGSFWLPKDKLTDRQRKYNAALKSYEEGYYVTFLRYAFVTASEAVKSGSLGVFKAYHQNMTDIEKSNMRKALMELGLTALILPLLRLLILTAFDDDDKDDEMMYFTLYQLRRLEAELAQFRDPTEATKIFNNPIASIKYIQNVLKFGYGIATPINFTPEDGDPVFDYLKENNKDENILLKNGLKLIPGGSQLYNDMKRKYTALNNTNGE